MSKHAILLSALLLLLLSPLLVQAQGKTPRAISLEEVISQAYKKNGQVLEMRQMYRIAETEQLVAKEWVFPTIYLGSKFHQLNGAAMNSDGHIFTGVDRRNLWAGLGINAEWDFGQGIYAKKAIDEDLKALRAQGIAVANQAALKGVNAYFDLAAAQAKTRVFQNMGAYATQLVRQLGAQVEAGLEYKSELLLAKSNFNHSRMAVSRSQADFEKASAALFQVLNISDDRPLTPADTNMVQVELVDLLGLEATASYTTRPEYQALNFRTAALKERLKPLTSGLLLPTLRLDTYDSYFGRPFTTILNTFEFNVSALWEIPLGQIFVKGKRQKIDAMIQLERIRQHNFKSQVNSEVSEAKVASQRAEEQLSIAKESLEFSGEALEQSLERQKLRTIRPMEVFQAQDYFLRARLDYIEAVTVYNKAQYALYVAMGGGF